jgi:competence protein ComEA
MSKWWGVAFGIVGGLLGAGLIFLMTSRPRGEAIQLQPPPTAPPLVVHVSGSVAHPGVYTLPQGCRAYEAIQAAGGLLPAAEAAALNLAALVQDGERIWVPAKAQERAAEKLAPPPESGQTPAAQTEEEPPASPTATFPININLASQAELESLPGIGPVIAQKIIAYREGTGPFTGIEEIQNVSGIGPKTFEKIADLITVTGP